MLQSGEYFFNNIFNAQKTYFDAVSNLNSHAEERSTLYEEYISALRYHSLANLKVLPSASLLNTFGKSTIFGQESDQLFLGIINGTLLDITDEHIERFLERLARLNFYVINEKVREFNTALGENVSVQFGDVSDFIGNTKILASKEGEGLFQSIKNTVISADKTIFEKIGGTLNAIREVQLFYNGNETPFWRGLFTQLSEATESIKDIVVNYTVPLDVIPADWKIYPGLCLKETLEIFKNIVNSDNFKLDNIDNIVTYKIVDTLVGNEFLEPVPDGYAIREDYASLKDVEEIKKFRKDIYTILQGCNDDKRFKINIDDIDSRIIAASSTSTTEV